MNKHAEKIIQLITSKKNSEKALWLENYVKHDIKSLGVGIPEIREILKQFEKNTQLTKSPISSQIEFLNELMKNEYTEPKLAAILFVQLYWKTENVEEILKLSSDWFNRWIADWNLCDWLCVRLLTPLVNKEPELTKLELSKWNKNPNLWKARASLVPFAQSRNILNHKELIVQFSSELIKREERFCKTAVGWVLREYSKVDPKFVTDFLDQYKNWTSKEIVKNATKYIGQKNRTIITTNASSSLV